MHGPCAYCDINVEEGDFSPRYQRPVVGSKVHRKGEKDDERGD